MTSDSESPMLARARQIASLFAALPQVTALAMGGSLSSGAADSSSDIDLYVYTNAEIPLATREAIVAQADGAAQQNMNLSYWGPGDLWIDAASAILIDCMYFEARWMEEQLERVLTQHQPSLGYSTCFWRTIQQSRILYDAQGWFQALQQRSQQPYPETLRQNIIHYNHPVLRGILTSYWDQLEKALKRQDLISVNHRLAALLASYFDILFALNRVLHPGEKRQVTFAQSQCALLPEQMQADLKAVLASAGAGDMATLTHLARLLDRLETLLAQEGIS